MRKLKQLHLLLLLCIVAPVFAACAPATEPSVAAIKLIPPAERLDLLPFEGVELFTGETVAVEKESEGRVRLLAFFSPG